MDTSPSLTDAEPSLFSGPVISSSSSTGRRKRLEHYDDQDSETIDSIVDNSSSLSTASSHKILCEPAYGRETSIPGTDTFRCQYDEHYFMNHRHQCSICRRHFSTIRLLNMHISERHDSFFKAKASREPSYECLVINCERKFMGFKERDEHVTSDHFMNVDLLWGHGNSIPKGGYKGNKTHRDKAGKASVAGDTVGARGSARVDDREANISMELDTGTHSDIHSSIDGLIGGIAAVSLRVPDTISFGHHRGRGSSRSMLDRRGSKKESKG